MRPEEVVVGIQGKHVEVGSLDSHLGVGFQTVKLQGAVVAVGSLDRLVVVGSIRKVVVDNHTVLEGRQLEQQLGQLELYCHHLLVVLELVEDSEELAVDEERGKDKGMDKDKGKDAVRMVVVVVDRRLVQVCRKVVGGTEAVGVPAG